MHDPSFSLRKLSDLVRGDFANDAARGILVVELSKREPGTSTANLLKKALSGADVKYKDLDVAILNAFRAGDINSAQVLRDHGGSLFPEMLLDVRTPAQLHFVLDDDHVNPDLHLNYPVDDRYHNNLLIRAYLNDNMALFISLLKRGANPYAKNFGIYSSPFEQITEAPRDNGAYLTAIETYSKFKPDDPSRLFG